MSDMKSNRGDCDARNRGFLLPGALTALAAACALAGCGEKGEQAPGQPAPADAAPALPDVEFIAVTRPDAVPATGAPRAETPGEGAAQAAAEPEIELLLSVVGTTPGNVDARRRLAHALMEQGRNLEAVEHFEELLGRDPGPRSLFELGRAYTGVSRLPDAERQIGPAIIAASGLEQA